MLGYPHPISREIIDIHLNREYEYPSRLHQYSLSENGTSDTNCDSTSTSFFAKSEENTTQSSISLKPAEACRVFSPRFGHTREINSSKSKSYQGLCAIINNETFTNSKYLKRSGTVNDENTISKTFNELGYEIMKFRDVKLKMMEQCITAVKQNFKTCHKKLVVFLLSHGEEKHFITSDCLRFRYKELISRFNDPDHIELRQKQRLFFFVCCRGSNIDTGYAIEMDGVGNPIDIELECDGKLNKVPKVGGELIGYAAYKSYKNYRHTINGTFFVNSLCENIMKKPTRNLLKIYSHVQEEVKNKVFLAKEEFQVSYIKSSLTGPCYILEE